MERIFGVKTRWRPTDREYLDTRRASLTEKFSQLHTCLWASLCDFMVLISWVLVTHLDLFKFGFSDVVAWHIDHPYSAQMSRKSIVVSHHNISLLIL